MSPTDEELIAAACRGEVASFGELYRRHYRLAVGIARGRLSDAHLAEDAAQEAFAEVFRGLSTLRQPKRFPQWLTTICRRHASRLAKTWKHDENLAADLVDGHPLRELQEIVNEALNRLDQTSREIVVLHYFSELSYEEIARGLATTPAAIHGKLQRARRLLAKWLAPNPSPGTKS